MLTGLAMLEIFDRRNLRHWAAAAAMAVVTVGCGLVWMGIRTEYRRDYVQIDNFRTDRSARIARIGDLVSGFFHSDTDEFTKTFDNFIDRMWPIYYPALAVARVPRHLPHTDGAIIGAAAYLLIEEALGGITEQWKLIFGPLLVLIVLFARGGLLGLADKVRGRLSRA